METALLLTAYEFGYLPRIKIAELGNFKGEVSIAGRVLQTSVKEFKKKDGSGLLARIRIADDTAEITAVLWNDAAELVKVGDIFPGCEVELKGFIRRSGEFGERIELSVNDATHVNILEQREAEVEGFFIGLQKISDRVDVIIAGDDAIQTFSFTEDALDKLKSLGFGDYIKIRFYSTSLEEIEVFQREFYQENFFTKLSKVREAEDMRGVNVTGRISGIGMLRKIVREERKIKYADLFISDESGRVRVLLWGDKSDVFKKADIGDKVVILNSRVKEGEIHCGGNSIVLLPSD
jgi:replication factor A1